MMKRIWAMAATIVLGLVGIAWMLSPAAHADEGSFLQAVANDGMPVGAPTLALGHQVCSAIMADGAAGVELSINAGVSAGIPGREVGDLIADAVSELCPAGLPAVRAYLSNYNSKGMVA